MLAFHSGFSLFTADFSFWLFIVYGWLFMAFHLISCEWYTICIWDIQPNWLYDFIRFLLSSSQSK